MGRRGEGEEGWRMEVSWTCRGVDGRSDAFDPVRSMHGSGGTLYTIQFLPGIPKTLSPKPIFQRKRQPRSQGPHR
jgi:hypothetical protein